MYLKGVVSFGTKKCGKGLPGVYINVATYIPWIIENLKH
jgi:secreted trypsin-like serine protease